MKKKGNLKVRKIVYLLCALLLVQSCIPTYMPWSGVSARATEITGERQEQQFGLGYVMLKDDMLDEDRYLESEMLIRAEKSAMTAENIPESYRSDQVSDNSLTVSGQTVSYLPNEMRNQGSYGCCWAFSALGAAEASLIRKGYASGDIDLSERHLTYYFYNKGMTADRKGGTLGDYNEPKTMNYLEQGGNSALTMWHLASWCGPVAEQEAPYSGLSSNTTDVNGMLGQENTTEMAYETDACHVQNIYKIDVGNMEDQIGQKDVLKKLIMEYGALGMSYYADERNHYGFECLEYDSYYNDRFTAQNHAILVVGWDDHFPKEHFSKEAPGDGAWLMKNSWGDEKKNRAQCGYFWLSYYDTSVNTASVQSQVPYAYVFDAQPADNYDNICQYDGDASVTNVTLNGVANCFRAGEGNGGGELLRAVGIGVAQSNVTGQVEIYKNTDTSNNDPTNGEKMLTQQFSLAYPGYHTIELVNEIKIPANTNYSVVFSFDAGTKIYISRDNNTSYDFVQMLTEENEGVSFCRQNRNWGDLVSAIQGVARVKAYTDDLDETQMEPPKEDTPEDTPTDDPVEEQPEVPGDDPTDDPVEEQPEVPGDDPTDDPTEEQPEVPTDDPTEEQPDDSTDNSTDNSTEDSVEKPGETPAVKPAVLTALSLNQIALTMTDGHSLQLVATPTYSATNASDWMVYWKSSNPDVVTVNAYGKIKAQNPGRATVTVYNGNIQASCLVTVIPKKVQMVSLSLTTEGKAKLKWKKTEGVTGYIIYRSTSENGSYKKVKTITKGTVITQVMPAVKGSKPYYYKVCAYKTVSGERICGEASQVFTCAPDMVKGWKATASAGSKVKLRWKKGKGLTGYEIYRSTRKSGGYKKIKTISKAKTVKYTDSSLKKGKKYYYKIRAYRTIKGKKIYGPYSGIVMAKAK